MSLIAYHNGVLVADDIALSKSEPDTVIKMQKLFVSPTSQFAYAYCGQRIHSRYNQIMHDAIYSALVKAEIDNTSINLSDFAKEGHVAASRTIIIMTSDRVFARAEIQDEELELEDIVAYGTNASAFRGALTMIDDVAQAAQLACNFITHRECTISAIKMSDLLPLPKAQPKGE